MSTVAVGFGSGARRRVAASVAGLLALGLLVAAPSAADPVGVPPSGAGGHVVGWGSNTFGVTKAPAALDGQTVTAIAAGASHSLALTADGRVVAWGYDTNGQTDVPASLDGRKVVAIAANGYDSLALTGVAGRVFAWGDNDYGQAQVPASLSGQKVTAIAAGYDHNLALTADGRVVAWGRDFYGQTEVPASLSGQRVTAIAAGNDHSLALTADGRVVAWGDNFYGQTQVPASLSGQTVTAIAAGGGHNVALTADGRVVAWGEDRFGETDTPASLSGQTVTAIAAGQFHNLALTADSQVVGWGQGASGETDTPASLSGHASAIAAGYAFSLAISTAPAPPAVAALAPSIGGATGGTPVTITGSGFTGATAVTFGGTSATSYTVDSDTRITAVAPSHMPGDVSVVMQSQYGTNAASTASVFTYVTPVVTDVSPTFGPIEGGQRVTITGSHFVATHGTATPQVFFGGTPATDVTVVSDSKIVVTTPAHDPYSVHVLVQTVDGTSSSSAGPYRFIGGFYNPPIVTGLSLTEAPLSGNNKISIYGTRLMGATSVNFGDTPAKIIQIVSNDLIVTNVPAHAAGTVDVTVTTPRGTTAIRSADKFTYRAVPSLTSVSPGTGPVGTQVTITGTGFAPASEVRFGSTLASEVTVVSPTRIRVTSPAHGKGLANIRVHTAGGSTPLTTADRYYYT